MLGVEREMGLKEKWRGSVMDLVRSKMEYVTACISHVGISFDAHENYVFLRW
jgi:hypothetical protein